MGANIGGIKTKTDIIGASVALESGGNVAAVKAKTDTLPTDPASNTQVNTRASGTDYTAGRAAKIDKIQDFLEEGFGTITADGTEQTVREYAGLGKLHAYIDLTNMALALVVAQSLADAYSTQVPSIHLLYSYYNVSMKKGKLHYITV